jgi:hypothetical protein
LRIARAAAEAFLCDRDAGGQLRPPAEAWLASVVAQYGIAVGHTSGTIRVGMAVILTLVEWLPLFLIGRWSRFSRLTLRERVHYLERLESHPRGLIASLAIAVKVPVLISAFEEGEALAMTGFDRPSIISPRRLVHPDASQAPPT